MSGKDRWLLPEGIEEVLPADAWRQERMRRRVLDLFRSWGYELVRPPLIEYLESLLTGLSFISNFCCHLACRWVRG